MADSSRLDVKPIKKEKDNALPHESITEPQKVYIHDEDSLHELREEIGALRDLFSRRLMNDKQKNELIQTLTNGATFAFIEPFIHDIILLLDRIERSDDEVVRSIRDELLEILERRGVETIKVAGEFDPRLCKAVRSYESDKAATLEVTQIVRKGYMISGKVIRHAEVVVIRPLKKTDVDR